MRFEPYDDGVVVPFPFTDKLVVKRRPALIISNHSFNLSGLYSPPLAAGSFIMT